MQVSLPVPASARELLRDQRPGPRAFAALVAAGLLVTCLAAAGVLVSFAVRPAVGAPALNLSLAGQLPDHLLLFWLR